MELIDKALNVLAKKGVNFGASLTGNFAGSFNYLNGSGFATKYIGLGNAFSYKGLEDDDKLINEGYASNTDVYAIINKIVETASNVPIVLYRKTPDGLEEVTDGELLELFINPNPDQVFKEFHAESLLYLLGTGDLFLNGITAVGFGDAIQELRVLESNLTEIIQNETDGKVTRYEVTKFNRVYKYSPDEVYHGMYFNPTRYGIDNLRGLSPLQAGYRSLIASNELITAEASVYKNKGVSGILSSGTDMSLTDKEAKDLQDSITGKLGGSGKANGVTTTTSNVKFQQIGMSPSDLEIFKSGNVKLQQLCRIYGVDSKLFGDPKASTYNNVEEVNKQLYTNAVIPNNDRFTSYLNRYLVKSWNEAENETYIAKADYSEVEVLQKDKKTEAEKNKILSENIITVLESQLSNDAKFTLLVDVHKLDEDKARALIA